MLPLLTHGEQIKFCEAMGENTGLASVFSFVRQEIR